MGKTVLALSVEDRMLINHVESNPGHKIGICCCFDTYAQL